MIIYKIKDKGTGQYSTGGKNPNWTKLGKTWSSIGTLKSHITLIEKQFSESSRNVYKNCEIVETEIKEDSVVDIGKFISENMTWLKNSNFVKSCNIKKENDIV